MIVIHQAASIHMGKKNSKIDTREALNTHTHTHTHTQSHQFLCMCVEVYRIVLPLDFYLYDVFYEVCSPIFIICFAHCST